MSLNPDVAWIDAIIDSNVVDASGRIVLALLYYGELSREDILDHPFLARRASCDATVTNALKRMRQAGVVRTRKILARDHCVHHPDDPSHRRGLCQPCYTAWREGDTTRTPDDSRMGKTRILYSLTGQP